MTKVEIFRFNSSYEEWEISKVINKFCENKDVIDIKVTRVDSGSYDFLYFTIIYRVEGKSEVM